MKAEDTEDGADTRCQQVLEDPGLLRLMMEDMLIAPDLYKPGNYWKNYEALLIDELSALGLHDFRRRRDTVLESFSGTDESPSLVGYYSRPRGNRARAFTLKESMRRLVFRDLPMMRKMRDTPAFSGLSLGGVHALCYEYARAYGTGTGAVSLDQIDASTVGNPFDLFYHHGRPYTLFFLEHYLNYAYSRQFVDFDSLTVVAELGSGIGRQVEILRKAHPHLCFYLFDIPPQLYVCGQYLEAVFPGAVVSYRETRNMSECPKAEKGRIFIFSTWKLVEMQNLHWDLFWNAASFQEMEPDLVLNYLGFVNRYSRKYVYLHEAMEGMKRATKRGEHGVLSQTKLRHYREGLVDFDLVDISPHVLLPRLTSPYDRAFWQRAE